VITEVTLPAGRDIGRLFKDVDEVAKRFASQAAPAKLSPRVPEWLKMHRSDMVALVGTMTMSNTTASLIK